MKQVLFCSHCGQDREITIKEEREIYPVKNEQTEITAKVSYCSFCGEQIWNKELDNDNLKEAYRKYCTTHMLLQPEEIKRIHEKYSVTQTTYGKILGFGEKTIARYETGSIQDIAHNNLIALSNDTVVFKQLIEMNDTTISSIDYEKIMKALQMLKPLLICDSESNSMKSPPKP